MANENLHISEVEQYLRGELDASSREAFENRISSDPLLKQEFEKKLFFESLNRFYSRQNLKAKLNNIHENAETAKPIKMGKIRELYPMISVAAAVSAIMVLLSAVALIYIDQRPKATFRELSRDMERMKKDQQTLIRNFHKTENKPVIAAPAKYEGSGFAISSNGYIVTSYHLIKNATQLRVENEHGISFEAQQVFFDPAYDIAILHITDSSFTGFDKLPYSISSKGAEIGEKIYTLGFPREDMVYGEGSISSNSGYEGDTASYQVSIPVNPGNSGGPVFDDMGHLVGLISGKQSNSEGAAFAVKASYLLRAINEIAADSVKRRIHLPKTTVLAGSRVKQIHKYRDFVFVVKAS